MQELIDASVALVNLPYTILLLICLLYWIAVILGALDVDVDLDVEVDADVGVAGGFLGFFNPADVPFMLIMSIASLTMWMLSVFATGYFELTTPWIALLLFPVNMLLSFTLARYVSLPFRVIFKRLDEDAVDHVAVVGSLCKIRSTEVSDNRGQAEVEVNQSHLVVNVRTKEEETLYRGNEAVVVDYLEDEDCYLVVGFDSKE